jgi:hypothetical protein
MSDAPPNSPAKDKAPAAAAPSTTAASQPLDADGTWGGFLLFLAQRVFLYCTLYVLSIGPLYWKWYEAQFVGGSSILAAFYLPLVALAEWVPPFGDWIEWYVHLWIA